MPSQPFDALMDYIKSKYISCNQNEGEFLESQPTISCECRYGDLSPFPVLTFQINEGHFYHLEPKNYLIPQSFTQL